MKIFPENIINKKHEIDLIVLLIVLYLFRSTIPFFKFPLIILIAIYAIYILYFYRNDTFSVAAKIIRSYYLSLILLIILLTSFFISNKLYLIVFKDIVNAFVLILIFIIITYIIKTRKDLSLLQDRMIIYILFFALFISCRLILMNVVFLYSSGYGDKGDQSDLTYLLDSISADYNFSLLPVFFGIIIAIYYLVKQEANQKKLFLDTTLSIFTVSIIFSGSRRGLIAFIALIIILSIIFLVSFFSKNEVIHRFGRNTKNFLISTFVISILLILFIFVVPTKQKIRFFKTSGISVTSYKHLTSVLVYKYSSIFSNHEYPYYQKLVWKEKFDPIDPDSGWGLKISRRVFPLTGPNVEIVPDKSIGYMMDNTCDGSSWSGNSYSYTDISNFYKSDSSAGKNSYHFASVYCFVSEDFDGTWAYIYAEGNTSGRNIHSYDFTKKGMWQKLSILFKTEGEIPPVYLYWAKAGVSDFSQLKGHIIFAYPEYRDVKPENRDPLVWGTRIYTPVYPLSGHNSEIVPANCIGYKMDNTCDASVWNNSAYSFTNISVLYEGDSVPSFNNDMFYASVYCFVSNDYDGSWANLSAEGEASGNTLKAYDLSKRGTWQKLEISFRSKSSIPPVYLYWAKGGVTSFSDLKGYVIFAYPQYSMANQNKTLSVSKDISGSPTFLSEHPKDASCHLESSEFITNDNMYSKDNFSSRTLYNKAGFNFFLPLLKYEINSQDSDKDPIRNLVAEMVSEDTTYFAYSMDISGDTVKNKFLGDRFVRWKFAVEIFKNEYSWSQKIFGGGFNFLNWFGFIFQNDKKVSDYPHNIFLSVLLYSGILGLIIYLIFIAKVFYYYIKYFREYFILSVFFFITFFFSFFSSGSPFDPPILGFFSILPSLINFIITTDKKEL